MEKLPDFTAEQSLYRTSQVYHAAIESHRASGAVYPAQSVFSDRPYILYCWRYICSPYIDYHGRIRWECSWINFC